MTILVVDDDIRINELLCDIFSVEGYDTISAFDGEQALKKLEKNKDIDLVVLDVMMPEFDGWEVLKYLKNNTDCNNKCCCNCRRSNSNCRNDFAFLAV